jgi:Lon-like protease
VLALLAVAAVALQSWHVPYYAITPGEATPVAKLIHVKGLKTDPHPDTIMLTDVYEQSLTALQYLFMHFQAHVEFIPAGELTDPGIPVSELADQGYLQMHDSKQAAEVAALRALGWKVPATPSGAVITGVVSSAPAQRAGVSVADLVVGANGHAVHSACDLIRLVHPLAPGARLRLGVERARIDARGDVSYAAPSTLTLTTAPSPSGSGASGCAGVHGPSRSWLGVGLENGVRYALPATITIDTRYIGGPSAGLAMTLSLIDQLSAGSLTGHLPIAATGTIDAQGHVGDVGGVAEKTVAVQRAGAKVFLVPQVEVATARGAAQPGLRVLGVTTLAQALKDLRELGGAAPVGLTAPR